jgi:hypothetical protein
MITNVSTLFRKAYVMGKFKKLRNGMTQATESIFDSS